MAFWSEPNLREPLRQNRWYITFGDSLIQGYVFALKECSKPEYKIETTSHVLLNHTFNYPKNLVWQPINIKMVSARDEKNNLASVLQARLDTNGYTLPSVEQKQLSKKLMSENMGLSLFQIDANGASIEEWKLYNPMITNVNYGTLTYENDGFVDIGFTITYDYAEFVINADTGISANIRYIDSKGNINNLKLENAKEEQVKIAARGLSKENEEPVRVGTPGFPSTK